jgi:hypothetical protein
MSVAADIWRSWRAPRRVLARLLAQGRREDRALAFLMLGCALIFVSEWPRLGRAVAEAPLEARLGGAMLAWLALMPLVFYALAGLSRVAARALGGQGSFSGARLALFWAVLAAAPLWLAAAAVETVAPGPAAALAGALALAALVWIWLAGLYEAERGGGHAVA